MGHKEELIQEILEMELGMFLSVSAQEPVSCQQDPESFRMTRAAQFSVWSEQTLTSYREDLKKAVEEGRNLMTLKYARMDNLIPKLHDDILLENLIDQIVAIQVGWQKEMMAKYPYLMKRGRPLDEAEEALQTTSFVNYLRGELETSSADTLAHLYSNLSESQDRNQNMAVAVYENMVKSRGFECIEEAEKEAELLVKGTEGQV